MKKNKEFKIILTLILTAGFVFGFMALINGDFGKSTDKETPYELKTHFTSFSQRLCMNDNFTKLVGISTNYGYAQVICFGNKEVNHG